MSTILNKAKNNLFLLLVSAGYLITFIVRPEMGAASIQNSGYYVKEMLMIMPVIFVLTALLDLWVPKNKITKYLGKEAGGKGMLLSLALGSISAGPVYAAFPMCVMLHKKGASIRNIVIILSSWAVIKVPMLLNEAKFLGPRFMAVRWVLTVAAILIFSWLTANFVKDQDLPQTEGDENGGLSLNREACMGCSVCTRVYPEMFQMQGKKAYIASSDTSLDMEKLKTAISSCPVDAIEYVENNMFGEKPSA